MQAVLNLKCLFRNNTHKHVPTHPFLHTPMKCCMCVLQKQKAESNQISGNWLGLLTLKDIVRDLNIHEVLICVRRYELSSYGVLDGQRNIWPIWPGNTSVFPNEGLEIIGAAATETDRRTEP